jgi:rhodanese-related sulfurtransferase
VKVFDTVGEGTAVGQGLKELLQAARSRIQEIAPDDAVALLRQDPEILFLDVRESEELAGGRIPGALHVPRGMIEPKAARDSPVREPQLSNFDRPVVTYCASGVRSVFAADSLRILGFSNVRSLAGGFGAWKDGGHPVE